MRRTRELLLDGVRCVCRELRVWGWCGAQGGVQRETCILWWHCTYCELLARLEVFSDGF